VVELVQVEGLLQVRPHGVQRFAQFTRGVRTELGFGEHQFVGGQTDALVGVHERLLGTARQIRVLCIDFFLLSLALAPESGHESILRARLEGGWCLVESR